MNRNDIGYIFVQYINDPNNGKKRPILIIRDSDEMLKFYKITSKYVNKSVNIKKITLKLMTGTMLDYAKSHGSI